jgi:hypothetical protein
MEEQLPNTFFRCHSAFLININAVESVKGAYAVVAGTMIPSANTGGKILSAC